MSSTYHTTNEANSYEDGYSIFLRRSNFREMILARFSSLVREKVRNVKEHTVLDIGCGDGTMTKRYLEQIKQPGVSLNLTLVDPAIESLSGAKELLSGLCNSIDTKTDLPETKEYSFILASYVFYHLPASTLDKMISLLAPGGVLAIMMGTNDNPLKTHPKLKELSSHGSSDKLTPFLQALNDNKDFSVDRIKIDTHTNLSGLWEHEKFTEEAKTYLSFAMNRDFEKLPDQGVNALRQIFSIAFGVNSGKLKSVHEIIWIERKS